uniref:Reverse transcriptase domain-containing protein n=1 Tax=Knipowitschia caucasica TaxID=637954 RepID=A0AAV2L9I1_KNICA
MKRSLTPDVHSDSKKIKVALPSSLPTKKALLKLCSPKGVLGRRLGGDPKGTPKKGGAPSRRTLFPMPKQRGFIASPGCAENVMLLNCLAKDARAGKRSLAVVFIDLRRAFDMVPHELILESLRRRGLDSTLVIYQADLSELSAGHLTKLDGLLRSVVKKWLVFLRNTHLLAGRARRLRPNCWGCGRAVGVVLPWVLSPVRAPDCGGRWTFGVTVAPTWIGSPDLGVARLGPVGLVVAVAAVRPGAIALGADP